VLVNPSLCGEQAATVAEEIDVNSWESSSFKSFVLGSLAERVPEPRRTELLERALIAAEGIGSEELEWLAQDASEALGWLAQRLPERHLRSFLVRVPDRLSKMHRKLAFELLDQLTTVIDFHGQEITLSISETIFDIGNRWR
jgi:hypothetical protein